MISARQIVSVLKFLLYFLCKLPCKLVHFTKRFIRKSWAPFIAFLGRLLTIWHLRRNGKSFRRAHQADHSFPGTGTSLLDVRQDQSIACTNLPGSACRPGPLAPPSGAGAGSGTARSQRGQPMAYPSSMFDVGSNRSCAGLSVFSQASNRLSIIHSHSPGASLHPLLHPKGNPKAAHRQFGCGPLTDHLEVTSHPYMSVSPTGIHGHHGGESSWRPLSLTTKIENPSSESLPCSQSVDPSILQEEPYSMGSPTIRLSTSRPPNLPEGSPQLNSTASLVSNFELPEGRFLQMIVSEQVPRYTKSVTV